MCSQSKSIPSTVCLTYIDIIKTNCVLVCLYTLYQRSVRITEVFCILETLSRTGPGWARLGAPDGVYCYDPGTVALLQYTDWREQGQIFSQSCRFSLVWGDFFFSSFFAFSVSRTLWSWRRISFQLRRISWKNIWPWWCEMVWGGGGI